jgi:hypothetical protein
VALGASWRGVVIYLEICISMKKVVWCGGTSEEGVAADLYECDLVS